MWWMEQARVCNGVGYFSAGKDAIEAQREVCWLHFEPTLVQFEPNTNIGTLVKIVNVFF